VQALANDRHFTSGTIVDIIIENRQIDFL